MVDSPTLDSKERPGGTLLPNAMCIGWLQEGLDYMHTRFPIGSTLLRATITLETGQTRYDLPEGFIQVYEDGLLHDEDETRLEKKGLSFLLDYPKLQSNSWGKPCFFTIAGPEMIMRPAPSAQWNGRTITMYYYGMPAVLTPTQVPKFPSDIVLVRYVYLRGLEWTRAIEPGTAEKYLTGIVADLQGQGISNEAESGRIPFDRTAFPGVRPSDTAWMGSTVIE